MNPLREPRVPRERAAASVVAVASVFAAVSVVVAASVFVSVFVVAVSLLPAAFDVPEGTGDLGLALLSKWQKNAHYPLGKCYRQSF